MQGAEARLVAGCLHGSLAIVRLLLPGVFWYVSVGELAGWLVSGRGCSFAAVFCGCCFGDGESMQALEREGSNATRGRGRTLTLAENTNDQIILQ